MTPLARLGSWTRLASGVLCTLFLSGCHTWVPVESPAPGSTVRVRLAPVDAADEGRRFFGTLVQNGDTVMVVSEPDARLAAYPERVRPDSLRVPAQRVTGFDTREVSVVRSVGLSVLVAGGAALLVAGLSAALGADEDDDDIDDVTPPVNVGFPALWRALFGG